ncbi:MAG TPA: ATP-binding protein, partial [Blastocatellia bacterium]
YSQLALNACPDNRLKLQLETIHKEGERARHIVQNLLSFARQHKPGRSQTDVNELLRACLDLRTYSQTAGNLSVRRRLADLPRVLADPHQLQQVFLNIIINAEQAITSSRESGNLLVKTGLKQQQGDDWVEIVIADDGPGIPPDALGRVFDPFFTTKDVGQGTGLGLSISYGIVKEHGGKIRVESQFGRGASFFVELPVRARG